MSSRGLPQGGGTGGPDRWKDSEGFRAEPAPQGFGGRPHAVNAGLKVRRDGAGVHVVVPLDEAEF